MATLLKELSVITGEYKNAQGEKKNRYTRIGSIIDTKNGEMLKIDVMPVMDGGWNGWAYINDPRPKDNGFSKEEDINF
jgi:hypothetical protein